MYLHLRLAWLALAFHEESAQKVDTRIDPAGDVISLADASGKPPSCQCATQVGDVYSVPISHGEGRFLANEDVVRQLAANGQIATQYVDFDGKPTDQIQFNPNNSVYAIEGITSPDGRVFGKMGHSERIGYGLYKNVIGEFDMKMFESAVKYFK